jgi:predicted small secreted protein
MFLYKLDLHQSSQNYQNTTLLFFLSLYIKSCFRDFFTEIFYNKQELTMRFLSLLTVMLFLGLTACNTVEGVGKDVQSVGTGVSGTAQDTSKAIDKTVKSDSKTDNKTTTTTTKKKK